MCIRDSVVWRVQSDDHCAHLRVNITENIRDPRFVELDVASGAAFIQSEIETFTVKQREHVVEEWIVVRKLDLPSHRNYQKRRPETLIGLHQLRNFGCFLRCYGRCRSSAQRREPDDYFRRILCPVALSRELHLSLECDLLGRRGQTATQHCPNYDPALDRADHVQNNIPIARFT